MMHIKERITVILTLNKFDSYKRSLFQIKGLDKIYEILMDIDFAVTALKYKIQLHILSNLLIKSPSILKENRTQTFVDGNQTL